MATTPTAGQIIKASDFYNLTTFTLTWSGVTVGSGAVSEGWYQVLGEMVFWGFRLEFGTSPSYTASALLTLPVAAFAGGGTGLAATTGAWGLRSSGTVNYGGTILVNDSGGVQVKFIGSWSGTVPSQNVGVSSSSPFTPASGNVFSGAGCYRAA
jgi:hypothetical protein